jgi:hypothetical protein
MGSCVTDQVTKRIRIELPILFAKTGSLEATIGRRVKNEMMGYDAPTVWSSLASLYNMVHETQSKVQDTMTMTAVKKDEVKEDVGKYLQEKLALRNISHQLKTEMSQDLSKYVEARLDSECSVIKNKQKLFKGEVHATVEEIGRHLQHECQ